MSMSVSIRTEAGHSPQSAMKKPPVESVLTV
jgi:hypothetical protein